MGKKDVIYTSLDGATGNIKNGGNFLENDFRSPPPPINFLLGFYLILYL